MSWWCFTMGESFLILGHLDIMEVKLVDGVFFEIMAILKEMGYINVNELWYSLGGPVLEDRLELLSDDKGACHVVDIAIKNGEAHLFVIHMVSQPDYIQMLEYDSQPELGELQGGEVEGGEVEGGDIEVGQVEGGEVEVGDIEVGQVDGGEFEVNEVVQGEPVVEVGQEEHDDAEVELGQNEEVHEVELGQQELPQVEVGDQELPEVEVVQEEHDEVQVGEHGEEGDGHVDEVVEEHAEPVGYISEDGGVGDASDEEHLVDVSVHGNEETQEEEEEKDWLGGIGRECSSRKKHVEARGLSDSEWQSDSCGSINLSDDSDVETSRYGDFATFKEPTSMKEYRWELGTYFPEKNDFIDAIRSYGVHNGRKLKLWKNDKRRISVKCYGSQGKCPWEFKVGLVTSKWLSGRLEKSIKANPDFKMSNLHNNFCKKFNVHVSRATTSRAKAMATANIEGSFKQQYLRLYDYAEELLRANPGSTVKINVEPNQDKTIFKRIYVCLKACKDNFVSCRPIIHLDGCSLKGKYGGELLTVVGRDANDQMCPLAYVVVEVENKESWTFFLELLIEDLGGGGFCSRCTFMSDQQKGLLPALQRLLPDVDQRYCVRHIYSNFRKKFAGLNLRQLLWKAATSTTPEAWESVMRQMKEVNIDAFKYLIQIPPGQVNIGALKLFTGIPSCDTLVNNISEGFNSVILDARGKPIISMLEEIRMYLMNRWASNREKAAEGVREDKILDTKLNVVVNINIFPFGNWSRMQIFQITHTSIIAEKYVVDVEKRDCSCRKWTITGIPCCHALTSMSFLNINPEEYLPLWFRTCTYEETYNPIIYPLNGPHLWQRTLTPDIEPPPKRVLPGRPRKKRRLEGWEQRKDDTQIGQKGIP
ncbi:hypothetical protein V8G54_013730 [Vigna mungo]|uniref:SWIM-type domain-containing protein n=1 Tax=Vigna mungo TaxID=3915 RepID=A0AAQ3NGC8_VIGMU